MAILIDSHVLPNVVVSLDVSDDEVEAMAQRYSLATRTPPEKLLIVFADAMPFREPAPPDVIDVAFSLVPPSEPHVTTIGLPPGVTIIPAVESSTDTTVATTDREDK